LIYTQIARQGIRHSCKVALSLDDLIYTQIARLFLQVPAVVYRSHVRKWIVDSGEWRVASGE
jgi:hypothetical protein